MQSMIRPIESGDWSGRVAVDSGPVVGIENRDFGMFETLLL